MSALATEATSLSTAQVDVLLSVLRTIAAHRDPNELFQALAETLRQVVRLSSLGAILYDETTGETRLYALETFGKRLASPDPPLLANETPLWHAFHHQEPVLIPSVASEHRFPRIVEWFRKHGVRSNCTLPLTTAQRRLGAFSISSEQEAAFSAETIALLSVVAGQVALAIGDALNLEASRDLESQAQGMCERLHLILDVNNNLAANLQLPDLLRAIAANIRRVMHCDLVGVALPTKDGKSLRLSGFDFPGSQGFIKEGDLIPLDDPLIGNVFRTGQPVAVSGELPGSEKENPEGLQCCCIVPVVRRERTLGVLALARRDMDPPFTSCDVEFLSQVAAQIAIAVENAYTYGELTILKEQLAHEKLYLEDEIRSEMHFQEVVGKSGAIQRVLHEVQTVAGSDSTVLILGETGTGKELIARAIHNLSHRRKNAFVKLNCAAIPTGLLESELFGHEKGAFTGAIAQHIGRFELAHQGTVFLDEIGDIPLELQPKLLRVLQEREFERLGSTRTLHTDARLIAATHRNLSQMVDEEKFRADLFYRLNVFPIYIPPLRERREDIPLLIRHFTQQFARRMNKRIESIATSSVTALTNYHWPGNIRELQNIIERAVILSSGPELKIRLSELRPNERQLPQRPMSSAASAGNDGHNVLAHAERREILAVLEQTNWVVAGPHGAATRLGLKRSTLQFRMRKLGLAKNQHAR